ncbi:MAG: WhiB family transcriptional regulator [Acidimicrobiales bacterium]|nr:WhiB family transcriptional regulator [Acidimicrobiales bacterium]
MLTPMFNDTDTLSTGPLSTNTVNSTWATEAACRTGDATNIALFFSEDLHDIAAAKRICAGCPALAPCLEGALEREEPAGVWGGQLFLNGRVLTVKRRRGRPPKVPRPEEQLPDVPVPEHLRGLLRTA